MKTKMVLQVEVAFVLFLASSLLTLIPTCHGVTEDEEPYREMRCIKPQPDVARNVDYRWMLSVPRFYIPIQSKLNFYRMAETLLEKPIAELHEDNLTLNTSCITYKWGDPSPKIFGFGDKTATFVTTPVIENSFGFKGTGANAKRGRAYITLKDDETFVLFTFCWEDNEASWAVITKEPTFDEEKLELILEHVKSLGFKEEWIVEQDFESCPHKFEDWFKDEL